MIIETYQGGFDRNLTYLVWCEETKHAALIDASTEINPILESIEKNDLILSKILITHSHHDHIAYLNDYLRNFPNLIIYSYNKSINLKVDYYPLSDNEIILIGNEMIAAIYTPGHFKDSICYWNKNDKIIFTGDTIFVGRTGRTISSDSSIKDLYNSVYNKLLTLPKETTIYPGHHYGFSKTITINENIRLFDFFSCNSFEEFKLVMQNFEKNR